MKIALLTICSLFFVFAAQAQTFYGTDDVERFRDGRDKEFRNPRYTPLTQADFANFKGLKYFEATEKYAVKARFEKTDDPQLFTMPTSIGASRKYIKYGVLKFELDGQAFSLTVFKSEVESKVADYKDLLFVPFRDLTNGKETYGAGRYLDIRIPSSGEVILNFNLAYNPNCAYGSDRFSCAIPPKENFLQIEIKAGEKLFKPAEKQ